MRAVIYPGTPRGVIDIPSSKSLAHRALICASLARGASHIGNIALSDDIEATLRLCRAVGARMTPREGGLDVIPADEIPKSIEVDCGQSGSTLRFAVPLALALGCDALFHGEGRLMERPMDAYEELCRRRGFTYELQGDTLHIHGLMTPGEYHLGRVVSSQFVSGMMMALGSAEGRSEIIYGSSPSAPYIGLTAEMMGIFGSSPVMGDGRAAVGGGYIGCDTVLEGDWSQGAVWACLGAALGDIECRGLDPKSRQGDRVILERLSHMGACISGTGFRSSPLSPLDLDCTQCPDLAPAAAACAVFCGGVTRLKNAGRLEAKESDRARAIVGILNKMGCRAERRGGEIWIYPSKPRGGAELWCFGDHRIVMMAAMLACGADLPTVIKDPQAVDKSYPGFWRDLASLGVKVEIYEQE